MFMAQFNRDQMGFLTLTSDQCTRFFSEKRSHAMHTGSGGAANS